MNNDRKYYPIIIIGAARSGTNVLRDTLIQFPDFGTWPCDEINYIWRYGNAAHPNDELKPYQANKSTMKYIRYQFARLANKYHFYYIVEKTCASSLRLGFIDRIFPEAKFIFIIRDGRDVIASAIKRWKARMDIPYLFKKARFVPFRDIPYYSLKYLGNHIFRIVSREGKLSYWGPRFSGFENVVRSKSLQEVCAIQWVQSVEKAEAGFEKIDSSRVFKIYYEDLVMNSEYIVKNIFEFLGINITEDIISKSAQEIHSKSVGKWKTELDNKALAQIEPIIEQTLRRHNYI